MGKVYQFPRPRKHSRLGFSSEVEQELNSLVETLGLQDKAAVVRKALRLIKEVADEMCDGGRLVVENRRRGTRKVVTRI